MAGYHIDPEGNPGRCKARVKCPWGDLEKDHYPSERTARRAYELEYQTAAFNLPERSKELLYEIGPRQLPNRAWVSLRNALQDDRFSAHELELARVTFKEEQEKFQNLLKANPEQEWDDGQHEAARQLPIIEHELASVKGELDQWYGILRDRVKLEFSEDFD